MRGGGEAGHVPAGLGDDHLGGAPVDAGDGAQQVDLVLVGLDLGVDAGVEFADQGVEVVDVAQDLPAAEPVVVGEVADQGLGEGGLLPPHPAPGQRSQLLPVAFPGDERGEHVPAGDPEDVGGHHGQLHPSHRCFSRVRSASSTVRRRVRSRSRRIGGGGTNDGWARP